MGDFYYLSFNVMPANKLQGLKFNHTDSFLSRERVKRPEQNKLWVTAGRKTGPATQPLAEQTLGP